MGSASDIKGIWVTVKVMPCWWKVVRACRWWWRGRGSGVTRIQGDGQSGRAGDRVIRLRWQRGEGKLGSFHIPRFELDK